MEARTASRANRNQEGAVAQQPRGRRARLSARWVELVTCGTAGVLAVAAAALVLRIWEATPGIPLSYAGDANYTGSVIKSILDHGWYEENPNLGAPFGQELYDFPVWNGDNLQLLIIKALGLVYPHTAALMNAFFLLTFALASVSAFLVFRRMGVSAPASTVCSVLFALLPYHFLRGEPHLFLAAYYAVPIGAYLTLALFSGEPLFVRRHGVRGRWRPYVSTRTAFLAALCIVIGSAAAYYAAFSVVLIAAAAVARAITSKSARPLAVGAVLIGFISATLAVNLAPALQYRLTHGVNQELERDPAETDVFSLSLFELILPLSDHRLDAVSEVTEEYESTRVPDEGSWSALGAVGAVGFLWLLLVVIFSAASSGRWRVDRRHQYAAAATLVALLFATTGGLSNVISYLITPQLHAWNRMSVFIAFFALLAVGVLLDALGQRLRSRGGGRLFVPILAVVLVLGILDQTSDSFVPEYEAVAAQYRSDGDFVHQIEVILPPGAAVFQLPYVVFPQSPPVHRMIDYDLLRGYLHSEDLRWSYGAMRGRKGDWAYGLAAAPASRLAPAVVAAGFDGIYIDRFGYTDEARDLESQLQGVLGVGPIVSENRRLSFFDLRPYAARLHEERRARSLKSLGTATLTPIRVEWGYGFHGLERDADRTWRWAEREARLNLHNPGSVERHVTLLAVVATGHAERSTVRIGYPDGRSSSLATSITGMRLERGITLRPGDNAIEFSTDAAPLRVPPGDDRRIYFRVLNARFVDRDAELFFSSGSLLRRLPAMHFGPGWHGAEFDASGYPFRWMRTEATLTVKPAGNRRARLRVSARLMSFEAPRRVTIRLGDRVLRRVDASAIGRTPIKFEIPAGRGAAVLVFRADPPAQPAASVTPQDPRSLAVALEHVEVSFAGSRP